MKKLLLVLMPFLAALPLFGQAVTGGANLKSTQFTQQLVAQSTNAATARVRLNVKDINVLDTPYNADPTGVADSAAGIAAAVAASLAGGQRIVIPSGTYKMSAGITLNKQTLIGDNKWGTILKATTAGMTLLTLTNQGNYVDNIFTDASGAAVQNYNALLFSGCNDSFVNNVFLQSASNAVTLKFAYHNTLKGLKIYSVGSHGILCGTTGTGDANNNDIEVIKLDGVAITSGKVGIEVYGTVNRIGGGEIYAVESGIIDHAGENTFYNLWQENSTTNLTQVAGVSDFPNCHFSNQTMTVLPNAMARNTTRAPDKWFDHTPIRPKTTALTALYLLNEGTGTTVYDASGNGRNGTISGGNNWVTNGYAGSAITLSNSTSGQISIPVAALDVTSPWSGMILHNHLAGTSENLIYVSDGTRYFKVLPGDKYLSFRTYDGADTYIKAVPTMQQISGWAWAAFTVNPTAKTVTLMDPVNGVSTFSMTNTLSGAATQVYLNYNGGGATGDSQYAFAALWQREIDYAEALQIMAEAHKMIFQGSLFGILPVIKGGTGSSTAPGALVNLLPAGTEITSSKFVYGTNKLAVSTGFVGVGTTNPLYQVDIQSGGNSVSNYSAIIRNSASVSGAGALHLSQSSSNGWSVYTTSTTTTNAALVFKPTITADGTDLSGTGLYMGGGLAGFGATPLTALFVQHNSSPRVAVRNLNNEFGGFATWNAGGQQWFMGSGVPSTADLGFAVAEYTNGTFVANRIYVSHAGLGNVGIGDNTPASLFTVGSGDLFQVNSSGAIVAMAGLTQTGAATLASGTGAVTLNGNTTITAGKTLSVGGGAAIASILSATATLDFPNILAAASADLTITVTGAAVSDSVSIGLPAAPDVSITFMGFVSGANTVTIRAFNVGAIAVDPASGTYRSTVTHF